MLTPDEAARAARDAVTRESRVKRNIVATFAGKGWSAAMSVAFVPLYIRFLGIESYGLIGVLLSLNAIFMLLDFGLSGTINRELARLSALGDEQRPRMRDLMRTLEVAYWAIAISVGLSIAALAPPIAHHWVKEVALAPADVITATRIMGLSVALQWPFSLYSGALLGLQRQGQLSFITSAVATVRSGGAALVLWLIAPTLNVFFLWQGFAALLLTAATAVAAWRLLAHKGAPRPRPRADVLREIWRYAAGLTGISAFSTILTQLDKIVLSRTLTLEAFGYYSLAGTVASSLYYLIGPVSMSLFPRFSQLVAVKAEDALRSLYHHSTQLLAVMIIPVSLVIAAYSSSVLMLWTHDVPTAANTHLILSVLIVGTMINGLLNLPYMVQLAYGWTRLSFYANALSAVVIAPMIYIAAMRYGAVGAASMWVVLNAVSVTIVLGIMHRRLLGGELRQWYLIDVGLPLAGSLVLIGASWLLFDDQTLAQLARPYLAAYLGVLLACTVGAAALLAPGMRDHARRIVHSLRIWSWRTT